ncbi:MAG: type II secretion system protein [Patescibacteria group bacterium]
MPSRSSQSGVTLVEVIVGIGIITMSLVTIGLSVNSYVDARAALLNNVKATYLAEEGYEIIRALRDDDWDAFAALAVDTTQYLSVTPVTIAFSATPEIIDTNFTRSFILHDVYRNGSDDIVASTTAGSTGDDGAREVAVSVVSGNGTTTFRAILTNLFAQ